ncbi:MAG: polyketide synthase dehydratase domain-containing protein, partial [Lysobacter sp.]|nr:polyketide synthase dehydratase domain-containing protein [Lysobacter sp.]
EYQTIAELADYFRTAHAQRLIELLALRAPAQPTIARAPEPVATQTARSSLPGKRIAATTSPAAAAPQSVPRSNRDADASHEPIAIVGLSGRYPQAWDLDGFWRNLSEGRDCIGEIPPERWRWQDHYRNVAAGEALGVGQHSSKWGGFIEGADEFDPRFFGITPRDAEQIDPQERLFLQYAWMAMEDAGYSRAALRVPRADGLPGQVGVYAGVMYGEYNRSGSLASIANRVSYVLNLHGPSMTLDTMCSSSLTALHLACQDLRLGRTDMALAGGVNLSVHPGKYSMLSAGQFISSAGHCQSFGEGGDGYIPGEGVGVAVLKRLSDAVRDGDAIHAVIRGSALNHGGKTNGYTVPNPQAQAAVIVDALRDAGVDARHVSYVEAHGTGTRLGDPIEIAALGRAFDVFTQDTGFCLIGSAKSNVGHCESAAGIAGLSKVVLQMRHRQIVPSLHSRRLNPHIDFAATPFEVNQRLRPWEAPVVDGQRLPRIAGLSSFGAGGSNAHLVIEEYIGEQVDAAATLGMPAIVPLSARTLPQLRQKAEDLKAFVERHAALDLHALAYTLQTGRDVMDERLGMRVASRADLLDKLALFLAADGHEDGAIADDVYYAQSRRHRDAMALFDADKDLQATVDAWFGAGKFARLLEVWSKGLDLDWLKLYGNALPLRMHLPAYPFARERYWRDAPADAAGVAGLATEALHSLVHRNASKPGQQRYHSSFRAEDPRIGGLKLHGQAMLPHGIQIESARAALVDALPMAAGLGAWELQSVRFAAPRALRDQAAVEIAILPPGQGTRPALDRVAFELSAEAADGHVDCQGVAEPCADAAAPVPDIATLLRDAVPVFADPETLHAAWRALGVEVDGLYRAAETLHRTADGLLLRLASSDAAQQAFADCAIDPAAAEAAMLAAQWLQGAPSALRLPASIARVRAFTVLGRPRLAWIRASAATTHDDALRVDIVACTDDGSVCFEMQALELMPAVPVAVVRTEPQAMIPAPVAATSVAQPAAEDVMPARMHDRVFRARAVASERDSAAVAQGFDTLAVPAKPQAVVLAAPDQGAAVAQNSAAGKPSAVSLTVRAGTAGTDAPASVLLRDRGNGILVLELRATEGRLDASLADALQQAMAQAGALPSLKALVLDSDAGAFPQDSRAALEDETVQAALRTLAAFPLPTVAMLRGDAVGAGFRLACACDLVVADEARR